MEIEQIRQELNHLLENIVEHSQQFSKGRQIPSLEISVVLAKINKMQERLAVLKHELEKRELSQKSTTNENDNNTKSPPPPLKNKELTTSITPTQKHLKMEVEDTIVIKKIQHSPIVKLADVFTLNDRYLYANLLFKKDMANFTSFVKSIDNASSFEEGKSLFNKAAQAHRWDMDEEITSHLYSLIERRFL